VINGESDFTESLDKVFRKSCFVFDNKHSHESIGPARFLTNPL
jgi:hypothetical protein